MKLKTMAMNAVIVSILIACTSIKEEVEKRSSAQPIHKGYSATADRYDVDGKIISNVDITAPLWNPRGKTKEQIVERAMYLAGEYDLKETDAQKARAAEAKEKYLDAIVINAVMPGAVELAGLNEESYAKGLIRNRDAGMTLTSTTAFAFLGDSKTPLFERMAKSTAVLKALDMLLVKATSTIRQAKKDGKLAVMFNSQGAGYVIDDMSMVGKVKKQGLHIANFTYNRNNALAGGSEMQDMGVTELGREFIKEANAKGVIVDVSHSSNQAALDAAKYTTKPIVASHSNSYALHPVSRNMPDEVMKAIGNTGGVICTTGAGLFINEELIPTGEAVAEHVVHTANLIGRDRTCFSTDYVHSILDYYSGFLSNVEVYPPEKGFGAPSANMGPEHIWSVVAVLEDKYRWNEKEIRGFLGENLMHVYETNWSDQ